MKPTETMRALRIMNHKCPECGLPESAESELETLRAQASRLQAYLDNLGPINKGARLIPETDIRLIIDYPLKGAGRIPE